MPTQPRTWLVTGVASFVGSKQLEALLTLKQQVLRYLPEIQARAFLDFVAYLKNKFRNPDPVGKSIGT